MNIISPGGGCSIQCDEELKYEVERLDGYHSEARWERTEGRRGGGAGVTSRKVRFGRELPTAGPWSSGSGAWPWSSRSWSCPWSSGSWAWLWSSGSWSCPDSVLSRQYPPTSNMAKSCKVLKGYPQSQALEKGRESGKCQCKSPYHYFSIFSASGQHEIGTWPTLSVPTIARRRVGGWMVVVDDGPDCPDLPNGLGTKPPSSWTA